MKPAAARLDERVSVSLPSEWRRHEFASGHGYVRDEDLARGGGKLEQAPVSLWIGLFEDGAEEPFERIEAVMRRRVQQGEPERLSAQALGLPTRGFDYTNGVQLLVSYFVLHPSGAVIEFGAAAGFLPLQSRQRNSNARGCRPGGHLKKLCVNWSRSALRTQLSEAPHDGHVSGGGGGGGSLRSITRRAIL